ncbi:hypothetical protein [Flavobacterium granuli]|uniref:HlyD family secretion protein n=1 Tax=Flavobacterium granuli TaxID=280093 RepID=A0ABU1S0F5_9FLAO|nr:hypothetical protein [Flavobacterium granuli]MDR6844502.1 hypothetical protein [Flavobacterium granuli]
MIQIIPYSSGFKEFLKYLGWILLFFFLWFNGCSNKEKAVTSVKVTVPEVKGKFDTKVPNHTPIVINANEKANVQKGETVFVQNKIDKKLIAENEKLKQDFAKANDSIRKLQFAKAIQLNNFNSLFENDVIKIDFKGIVQGEVKEVIPTYTLKERKLEVPVQAKETAFRVLAGIEVGNNTALNDFKAKANLMFQNRKGNVLTASFDTNQTIWVGYSFSILNIKR